MLKTKKKNHVLGKHVSRNTYSKKVIKKTNKNTKTNKTNKNKKAKFLTYKKLKGGCDHAYMLDMDDIDENGNGINKGRIYDLLQFYHFIPWEHCDAMQNLTLEIKKGKLNKLKESERYTHFINSLSLLNGYILYDTTGQLKTDSTKTSASFLIGSGIFNKSDRTISLNQAPVDSSDKPESFSWKADENIYVILNNFTGDQIIRQPDKKDKENDGKKIDKMKRFTGGTLLDYLKFCFKSELDEQTRTYLNKNNPQIKGEIFFYTQKDIRYFSWSRRKARIDAEIESLRRTRADYIKQRLGLNVTDQKAAFKDRN
jgi:hypothetical protein